MSSPDVTKLILDCEGRLLEARNLLLEAENTKGAGLRSLSIGLREKSLAIVKETIDIIKNQQPGLHATLQDKIRFVKLRDSALSLAFMIHLADDDIESAANLDGSIPLSELEFPTFSIALKAIPFFIERNELIWPWDALSNIIRQFDTEIYEEAKESNRLDLWLLILFSGILSEDRTKVALACKQLSNHESMDLNKITNLANALDDKGAGRIHWNTKTNQLEYDWKSRDTAKAIRKKLESPANWNTTQNVSLKGMRGVPALTIDDVKKMLNSESDLMRGLGMSFIEAGGPEGLMRWAEEMRIKYPAMRRILDEATTGIPFCSQCREIIAQHTKEYPFGQSTDKTVVCPSCGFKHRFSYRIVSRSGRNIPPQ